VDPYGCLKISLNFVYFFDWMQDMARFLVGFEEISQMAGYMK
jgi:hypothetical protein